jgi:hypothetical protein
MGVPLNFQAGLKCDAFKFMETYRAELLTLISEVTKSEQPIVIFRVHFTNESGRATYRVKEFDHWRVVLIPVRSVSQELVFQLVRQ